MSGLYHFVIITVSMTVLIGQIYSKPYNQNTTESDVVPFKPLNVDLFDVVNKNIFNESNSQVVDLTSIIKKKVIKSLVIQDKYDFVFPKETNSDNNSSDTIDMNMTLETTKSCENETVMIPNRVIFEAPEHCSPGYIKDTRGRCRKLIKDRISDDSLSEEDDDEQQIKCDS